MAYSVSCRFAAVCVFFAAVILLQNVEKSDCHASHYVSYNYTVSVAHYTCQPYYYTYCYNWWYYNYWYWDWYWYYPYYWGRPYYLNPWYGWGYWNWCYRQIYYSCYYYYTTETRTAKKCADKWTGDICNVPICTQQCLQGMICSDVDTCTCIDTGPKAAGTANCQILPCSPTNNCYPGTCTGGTCVCPPSFNGTNCEQILQQPTITTCGVSLTASASPGSPPTQVVQASCASPGESPVIVWVNSAGLNIGLDNTAAQNNGFGLSALTVTWTPSYVFQLSMPTRPTSPFFVSNAPVAIYLTEATYSLTFPDDNNFTTRPMPCNLGSGTPTQYDCVVTTSWSALNVNPKINHNKTVIVNMAARLGGFKTGDSAYSYQNVNYGFGSQQFTGVPITYKAAFKFDLNRPTHCLLVNSSNPRSCTGYPIQLGQDMRTDDTITPMVTDWFDDLSGISKYSFQVFFMQPDAYGILSPNGNAYPDSVTTLAAKDVGNYRFTVPGEGTYSIIVTAYDHANNSAQARKIFNYLKKPLSYTVDSTKPVYIQEANPNVNYTYITQLSNPRQLTVVWTGRFIATEKWRTIFAARVNPLGTPNGYTIDDVYGTQFGQRSIAAHENQTGVAYYTVSWYVDKTDGGIHPQPDLTDNSTTKTVMTESATIDLTEPLTSGSAIIIWVSATSVVDPSVNTTFRIISRVGLSPPNISAESFVKNGGTDGYFSRLTLYIFDKNGGINATNYTVVDVLNNNNVVIPPTWQPMPTRLYYSPPSKRKKRVVDQPCSPTDTTCYCTPFRTCFDYVQIIDIDNCRLDRYSNRENFNLQLQYWVTNLAGISTGMNYVNLGDISGVVCRPSPTNIVAIVLGTIFGFIGLLLLICLIILLVIIIIRLRNHQHPIPSRKDMRTYAHNVRNRFSMRQADRSANNDLYVSNETAPPGYSGANHFNNNAYKGDSGNDGSGADKFKIPKKQVQFSDILAEGKFAVIRRGYYIKANDKQPVAVKALKNGFSSQDELLMAKKITFMKNVPQHGNLVAFYGFIDENENEGQGPVMVLELCDYPMTNWLERLSNVTGDDLEQMLIFALNIAQGVQHLHNNKIIHRRLAARNVLVKQQVNGLVAKLIGFGPTAEDTEISSGGGTGAGVAIPKKWLAPETLDTSGTSSPTYNEKTDAWSYGVTIWEIYSKGAAPYQDARSNDIHNLVKRGKRLQRPSDCPDELYAEVMQRCWEDSPKKRPTFHAIQDWIQRFRSGNNAGQDEYYAANN